MAQYFQKYCQSEGETDNCSVTDDLLVWTNNTVVQVEDVDAVYRELHLKLHFKVNPYGLLILTDTVFNIAVGVYINKVRM